MIKDKNSSKKYKDLVIKIENLKYVERNREYFLNNMLIFKDIVWDRFVSEERIIEDKKTARIYDHAVKAIDELVNYTLESKTTYTIRLKKLNNELSKVEKIIKLEQTS